MKNTTQMLTTLTIGAIVIITISVGCRYDGLVQVKLGLDGGQFIIDGRR